jgi:acetyltransferase-like isoleucine patch superfamily enzyme
MLRNILRRIKNKLDGSDAPLIMTENWRYNAYEIGEGTYGRPDIRFYDDGATLKIGNYCSIAGDVTILLGGEHHHDWVSNYPFSIHSDGAGELPGYPMTKGDVIIGNDVWIGYDALILSGVKIGDGAVIAARALVNKDVEPYSIVGGVPAKHLRYRFSAETIKALQEIAWWNWSAAEIRAAWHLLQSPNINDFIARYSPKTEN